MRNRKKTRGKSILSAAKEGEQQVGGRRIIICKSGKEASSYSQSGEKPTNLNRHFTTEEGGKQERCGVFSTKGKGGS